MPADFGRDDLVRGPWVSVEVGAGDRDLGHVFTEYGDGVALICLHHPVGLAPAPAG